MINWIPCSKSYPETFKRVLLWEVNCGIGKATAGKKGNPDWAEGGDWYWISNGSTINKENVTHWADINPPEN